MSPIILIAAGVALFLAFGGGRKLTKADLPTLAQLSLVKRYIARDVKLCAAKAAEAERKTNPSQVIGYAAGLFTGAATLDFKLAYKVAKNVSDGLDAVIGLPDACKTERARLADLVQQNDTLSRRLGLPPDLSVEQLQKLIAGLGGLADVYSAQRSETYKRCVKFHGADYCDAHGVPKS